MSQLMLLMVALGSQLFILSSNQGNLKFDPKAKKGKLVAIVNYS